ncbi:MAG: YncE family protein [Oscillospiraceae bacterium]
MKKATISLTILVLLFSMVLTGDNNLVYAETKGQEQQSILLNLSSDNEFQSDAEYYADFQPYSIPAFDGDIELDDSPPSIDRAPLSISEGDGVVSLNSEAELYGINSAPSAYGVDLISNNFYRWPNLTLPGVPNKVNKKEMTAKELYAGGFMGEDFSRLYAINDDDYGLYAINTLTAEETLIGIVDIPANSRITGMAAANEIMYIIILDSVDGSYCVDGTTSRLAIIVLETAEIFDVGTLPNSKCMIDIAFVPDNGMLYGVDLRTDSLHRINPRTASDSIVGNLGIDANYAQGMDYDVSNNVLYWAAYSGGGASELRIIDINTGASAQIGTYPDSQKIDSFAIVSTEDDSFLPNPNGYSFENYIGINFNDLTIEDLRYMFGDENVCQKVLGNYCIPKVQALLWKTAKSISFGHCEGMSVSSLRYFAGSDFHPEYNTVFDLEKRNNVIRMWNSKSDTISARKNIAFFQVLQSMNPVKGYKNDSRNDSVSVTLQKIISALQGPKTEYLNLFVRKPGSGGHAITPYKVVDRGNGGYWVYVYDNNHPNDFNRKVVINTIYEKWMYDMGGNLGFWEGDSTTNTMGVVPLSVYAQQPICPWCDVTLLNGTPEQQILFDGSGELLVRDSQNRRLGYENGVFFSEIPNAYIHVDSGGLGVEGPLVYTLPSTETYTMHLTGTQEKQAGEATLMGYGPGYAINLENILVNSSTNDIIVFSDDGTNITYTPNQNQNATLATAVDTVNGSWQLQVDGLLLTTGQQNALTVNTTSEGFTLNANNNDSAEYEIFIMRSSDDGLEMYSHKAVSKNIGETHTIRFGVFKDQNIVILDIDRDGDGVIDESIPLENQAKKLYFPMISN